MFDPLFPVALFCGPVALAILLRVEAKRTTRSIWPLFASVLVALAAMWGLTYWVLMLAVVLFGEGMNKDGFYLVTVLAVPVAVVIVVGGYVAVTRHRREGVPR